MATIRATDLDNRRPDYELNCLIIITISLLSLFILAGMYASDVVAAKRFPRPDLEMACLILGMLSAFLWSIRLYLRSVSRGRTLILDLDARTYEVRAGLFQRSALGSGRFEDFARVRLERKGRRVYDEKRVKQRRFWTTSLVWKAPDQRPFCLQERKGEPVPPPAKFPRGSDHESIHQARADAERWGRDLGVPVIDMVRTLDEESA